MRLKRVFKRDEEGKLTELDHIEVEHTGTHEAQNFSTGLVASALREGWMELAKGKLILKAKPEDLKYTILREPGRYCLHCQEKLLDDEKGEMALIHVLSQHRGLQSPDPSNPAGYVKINAYECMLDVNQHAKYQAKKPGA
jgi:hypothetical protein